MDRSEHRTADESEQERLLFSTMLPAALLALRHGFPLKRLKVLLELSLYREARRRGLKMKEISDLLSVSMSKVGLLSSELKQHFVEAEEEHGLPRQILSLLWSTPLSAVRIAQAIEEVSEEEVEQALELLVEQGRVLRVEGRTVHYELASNRQRLDLQPWIARIDGLNTLMRAVAQVIEARLLRGQEHAAVRNLAFRVRREDLPRLQQLYEEQIFPTIGELDDRVGDDDDSVQVRYSILWSYEEDSAEETDE